MAGARGELFIVSAPSGAGKSTLIRELLGDAARHRLGSLEFAVSHTTRRPRPGEVDGREYHFVDRRRFESMVAEGLFLEWAEVHGELYGTSSAEVDPRLERGVDVVLDIDVQGAAQARARRPGTHSIFILPPSFEALAARLGRRGAGDAAETDRRLRAATGELERWAEYDYVIVNDDLTRARDALAALILEKRHRLPRQQERVEEVLRDFRSRSGGGPSTA